MRLQPLCLGTGLFAVIAIVASGCSSEKKTTDPTTSARDERSSIVQAPKIHRSAAKPSDTAQAVSPTDHGPADDQPKTSGDPIPGDRSPDNPVSPAPKGSDNPHSPATEPMSSVPQNNPPNENPVAKPQAKNGSSQFDELISVPTMPVISLTSAQQATCLLGQGDTFPPLVLSDLSGKRQPLKKLFGKKLTVVVCWHSDDPFALEELADLEPLVSARFGTRGVLVVAISVRGMAERNQDLVAQLSLKFPLLLDPKGDAWNKLASESAEPSSRTFLLDARGQIIWFDIEYSRSTRRDLVLAIRHQLQ